MSEVIINTDILSWSITRAGLNLNDLEEQFPKVREWISGDKRPTIKQLEAFSKKVHLAFGFFFLNERPNEAIQFPFFRRSQRTFTGFSLNLYDTIQIIQRRQAWLSEYLTDIGRGQLDFVGKFDLKTDFEAIANDIRTILNLEKIWAARFTKIEETINHLVNKIEEAGITTTFNGVVENSNRRSLSVDECRGFVIVDRSAPFMFINNADFKSAQLFTIVHELAHIWLGISAGFENDKLLPANDPVEILCDKVAAEFLVPSDAFLRAWSNDPRIESLTRFFKVSRVVIARRALDLGKIKKSEFLRLYQIYAASQFNRKDDSEGGDFFATQKKRIGLRFATYVNRAVQENKLLYRDAYRLTGIKGDTYQKFMNKYLRT